MQERLESTLIQLGSAERSLVEEQYGTDLRRWAEAFDQIYARPDMLAALGDASQTEFNNLLTDMEAIYSDISRLNMLENPTALEHVKNRMTGFKNAGFVRLLDLKNRLRAIDLDTSSVDAIRQLLEEAKLQAQEYKNQNEENAKSFAENLKKQAKGSTRTLAQHFHDKLKALNADELTSPTKWQKKRIVWLRILVIAVVLLPIAYVVLLIVLPELQNYAIQIGIAKLTIVGLAYLQYNFAARNFHISADYIARYEQQEVIAKTLNDFIATASEDSVLKEHILSNATKTLFAEINTGHLKDRGQDGSMVENIINQWPKSS